MASSTAPAPAAKTPQSRRMGPRRRTIVAFLLPFTVPFVLFYIVPVCYAIWQSLHVTERTGGKFGVSTTKFGWFQQYQEVLGDPEFWSSAGRMFKFGIVQVPLMLGLAMVIALLLDSTLVKFKPLFRISAFMPYAVPGVIAALMWSFLYHPQISPVVELLNKVGVHPDFLAPGSILWSIANISTWLWTGYNMLIMYSALQAIPQELYEAAKLDGASNWTVAIRIKIPNIAPAIIMTAVFSIIGTLQLYSEPAVLKQIAGSISSTYTPNMMAYAIASGDNYQKAAALAVILAIGTFILSYGFMRITSRKAEA